MSAEPVSQHFHSLPGKPGAVTLRAAGSDVFRRGGCIRTRRTVNCPQWLGARVCSKLPWIIFVHHMKRVQEVA